MAWLIQLIKDLCNSRYYGKVIVSFEAGKPVHVEKRISMKPPFVHGQSDP